MKNRIQDNKMTPLGLIPIDWEIKKLSDIFEFKNGLNKEKKYFGEGSPIVNYVDVYKNRQMNGDNIYGKVKVTKSEKERFDVKVGDVFFTRTSETINEIGFSSVIINPRPDTVFSGFVLRAREKSNTLDNLYKKYCFSTHLARKEIITKSSMTTRALTSGALLGDVFVIVPPLIEQKKIAEILSTWDDAISIKSRIIEFESRKKKAIVSKVYRGNLSNSPDFSNRFLRLKKYLREIKKKNGRNDLPVLSVSNSKGFILQEEQFDRVVASTDRSNYKVVEKDQFAYNPSRVNVGSIDLMVDYDKGILSPMYVVFKCQDGLESRYLYHFLKSDLFLQMIPKYTQGSVRDSLSFSGLTSMKMYIPSIQEQTKYINALDAIDRNIAILNNEVQLLKKQKQGLMQQLLTGKIRVNVN